MYTRRFWGRRTARFAILSLALLAASFANGGCEGAANEPTVRRADVEIVSAGSEPRRVLLYQPSVGTTQRLEVRVAVELEAGQMGGPMPTLVLGMTMMVEARFPTGHMKLRARLDHVSAEDQPGSQVPAVALTKPMEAMKGLSIDALLAADGRLFGARLARGNKQLPVDLEMQVSALIGSFEQTMMPLPDVPVGVGAVWRNSRPVEQNGMKLKTVNTIALSKIEGDSISYTIDTSIHGADQTVKQGDTAIEMKDIVGQGGGSGTIDLAALTVTSELASEFRSSMTAPNDVEPTKMTLASISKVRTLPPPPLSPSSAPPPPVPTPPSTPAP
jgi:hypothetical protein